MKVNKDQEKKQVLERIEFIDFNPLFPVQNAEQKRKKEKKENFFGNYFSSNFTSFLFASIADVTLFFVQ